VAKRRSHAVLVDHLQTVMVKGELYGDLEQLERLLEGYARYHASEPARAHTIAHLITDKVKGLKLLDCCDESLHERFGERVREIHDRLSLLKNTFVPKGMHVFGRLPEGDKLAAFVYAVARFDNAPDSLRGVVAGILGRRLSLTGEALDEKTEEISERVCRDFVLDEFLDAEPRQRFPDSRRGRRDLAGGAGRDRTDSTKHPDVRRSGRPPERT